MSSPTFDAEITRRAGARSSFGALAALPDGFDLGPCPYPDHRPTDWQHEDGGPVTCGVCHPRASELAA